MNRIFALLTAAALTLSPALAKDYSEAETDTMNHALMDYALNSPGNYLYENKGFDFYLYLQDHDANAAFIQSFGDAGNKLKPWSSAVHLKVTREMMESGHAPMKITISDYHAIAPDQARAFVDARCGMTCGGQNLVTLQKTAKGWTVTKFENVGEE
ncbi:MAG TPA: hypothetical protein VNW15_07945 [Rhizomicrobium sp.]|jgi:hypothetical protein|nr:hypothetical protein [Rhizomicrobium sp.]